MTGKGITILGGGSMGTALAKMLGDLGREVVLWVYEPELADTINSTRTNPIFLADFPLPRSIRATNSLAEAVGNAHILFSVTPAQHLRTVWEQARNHLSPGATVISASKGIEVDTAKLMSDVLSEIVPPEKNARFAFLSGPSFAREIAAGQPTAVVIAAVQAEVAEQIQQLVATPFFRAYTTDDVVGVELGGALKNVIALAVGAAEGMELGHNSRAALITRGLAEVSRLAGACGASPLTLAGLAGVGDLVLTCTGHLSRNLQVGIRLGRGESLSDILASMTMVAEGVATTRSTLQLAEKRGVEMPITQVVAGMLDGEITPKDALRGLMSRRLRSEKES